MKARHEPDGTTSFYPEPPHRDVQALFDEFQRLNGAHLSDAFALALTRRLYDELAAEDALEEITYPAVRVAPEHGERREAMAAQSSPPSG